MNKSLPAAEHYDTFDRSCAHWRVGSVEGMKNLYTSSTADCGHWAGDPPSLEAYLQRCAYDDMPEYGCPAHYLENAIRDGAYRFQQSINILVSGTELEFFVFWKQD
jgi:hypothetical protein